MKIWLSPPLKPGAMRGEGATFTGVNASSPEKR